MKDYNLCCAHPENTGKCCSKSWTDMNAPDHNVCCSKNLGECCTKDIYWNSKHADHKICCEANPDQCKPNPEPCQTKEKYDLKADTHISCCLKYPIKEWCPTPKCEEEIFKDISKKGSNDWITCCGLFPENPLCEDSNCDDIFLTKNDKTPGYKKCCDDNPKKCPVTPECYPETVFTDSNDENHKKCCQSNPAKQGCDTNKKCTNLVF